MAEYVRMPKAHYAAACESIRAKTGKTDKIKSGDMSTEIDGITTGGGSSVEILENMPIELDFTTGNQGIVAPDGMAVKSAIIQKPDTLIPENIADGVNIAGIVGALAAGGGGGGAKTAVGTYAASSNAQTITHNLGVVPDVVICTSAANYTGFATAKYFMVFAISSALSNLYPDFPTQATIYYHASLGVRYFAAKNCPADTTDDHYIRMANETTFGLLGGVQDGFWIAIGGIT